MEVSDLNVTLDGAPVLTGLNFSVSRGEFLTILGPNGSGKTVLLKVLLGLLPYQGRLRWREKPRIGYLPQDFHPQAVKSMPLTVADFFRLKSLPAAAARPQLEQVGLDAGILNKRAGLLSGGEFQRMLIAWVLASDPNVLLLDEPTTAVDVAGGATIYSLLNAIWRARNLTIFNVTHDLNIVLAYSSHVLCLARARHICYGPPREALTPEVLQAMYGEKVKHYTHG